MAAPGPSKHIYPRVGVAVFIFDENGNFVVGKRKGSHGAGTVALPGGHLELFESFEECAARESLEETGLRLQNIKFLTATNDLIGLEEDSIPDSSKVKHYVTVFVGAMRTEADFSKAPEVLEPHKCEAWEWIDWKQVKIWAKDIGKQTNCARDGPGPPVEGISDGNFEKGAPHLFLPILNLLRQRGFGFESGPWEEYQAL